MRFSRILRMPDLSNIASVEELTDIAGKRVLVRVDFNVPLSDGRLRNTLRIDAALPTIKLLLERGAKVILASHRDDEESLAPIAEYLHAELPVFFAKEWGEATSGSASVVLLENLRLSPLEEQNDEEFARSLASLADYYVNEAFSASHRAHASIVGVPKHIPAYAGLRFMKEVQELGAAFSPEHPFLFILGGAKVGTKAPILKKFLKSADTVFVGGVLANDFLSAKGYPVGQSVLSEIPADPDLVIHPRAILPEDLVVVGGEEKRIAIPADVGAHERIVDIGPETISLLGEHMKNARLILWNGPLGLYEEGHTEGSLRIGEIMASSSARTILGGGDTLSVLPQNVQDRMTFVSTGGGAMLHYLSEETLPGLEALRRI